MALVNSAGGRRTKCKPLVVQLVNPQPLLVPALNFISRPVLFSWDGFPAATTPSTGRPVQIKLAASMIMSILSGRILREAD